MRMANWAGYSHKATDRILSRNGTLSLSARALSCWREARFMISSIAKVPRSPLTGSQSLIPVLVKADGTQDLGRHAGRGQPSTDPCHGPHAFRKKSGRVYGCIRLPRNRFEPRQTSTAFPHEGRFDCSFAGRSPAG